ncbi:hypothetical protein BOX15_Mlig033904g1 [Macrostomum lignano]|uniref:Uncharacterized protein n=1 Tax=Macrostomum lignano TaxID=282301 RepID=A0A267F4Z6_9PLAT|nr:hypothetical protein BOX15_Mlig033904g1 [Macrostomum lignano]
MSAANDRRWCSPFPPTNSADERRFDDVTLAAPKARAAGAGWGSNWLLPEEDEAAVAAADGADRRDCEGRLRFGNSAAQGDADSEFELNTGGGRVIFTMAPRGPWPGRGQPLPPPPSRSTSDFDHPHEGHDQRRSLQPSAVLHRAVHTRPLVTGDGLQHRQQLPAAATTASAPAQGSGGSKRFSLRRLFGIKSSSRHSVSRSRSSASAATSALTVNTTTPQSSRSVAVNGAKSMHTYTYSDTKMYHHHHPKLSRHLQYQPQQQPHYQNGFSSGAAGPPAVRSRYNADVTLGSRSPPQPAPDYWRV